MAVEAKRGCGYRKVGGLYLVSDGEGIPCDRLPIRLDVCPVCSHGFKQARGWTWVDLFGLVGGQHEVTISGGHKALCQCFGMGRCPLCHDPKVIGKAGLLWIGEKFYKMPSDFMREGRELGISKRVKAIPRNFKVGETWVMLAHPKAIRAPLEEQSEAYKLLPDGDIPADVEVKYVPAIFTLWRPKRIEKICKESERESEEVKKLIDQGITPVFVPDNDPDHQGTVYDKDQEELGEEIATEAA